MRVRSARVQRVGEGLSVDQLMPLAVSIPWALAFTALVLLSRRLFEWQCRELMKRPDFQDSMFRKSYDLESDRGRITYWIGAVVLGVLATFGWANVVSGVAA